MNGGIPHQIRGSLKEKFVKLAPYGPAVSEAVQKDATETIAQLESGELLVYKGPIATNTGDVKVAPGTSYKLADPALDKIDWLTAGIIGSVS